MAKKKERNYHTKQSKSEKDILYHYMWTLKNNTNELIYRTETDSQTKEKLVTQEEVRGEIN